MTPRGEHFRMILFVDQLPEVCELSCSVVIWFTEYHFFENVLSDFTCFESMIRKRLMVVRLVARWASSIAIFLWCGATLLFGDVARFDFKWVGVQ